MSDKQTPKRSRKWVYTLNNPTQEDLDHWPNIPAVKQHICGMETGNSGTPHFQGFIEFKNAKTMQAVKKAMYNNTVHLEHPVSSDWHNWNYCMKDNSIIVQVGEMPPEPVHSNSHSDWDFVLDQAQRGRTMLDILENKPHLGRYVSAINRVVSEVETQTQDAWRTLDVTYITGPAGVGKSRAIMEKHGHEQVYRITDKKNPWDGYRGQPVVVFEEYRSNYGIENMLNWLDGYPIMLPCRYANRPARFTTVYLVTNLELDEQFCNTQELYPSTWGAFLRRIRNVIITGCGRDDNHVTWAKMTMAQYLANKHPSWLHLIQGEQMLSENRLEDLL